MARLKVELQNIVGVSMTIRDLNEATVYAYASKEVSETNTYDAIMASKDLHFFITNDQILIILNSTLLTKSQSLDYMDGNVVNSLPVADAVSGFAPHRQTGTTSNDIPIILTDGLVIVNDQAYSFNVRIIAVATATTTIWSHELSGVIMNKAGSLYMIGEVTNTSIAEDASLSSLNAEAIVGATQLLIRITGKAATNISWASEVSYTKITM